MALVTTSWSQPLNALGILPPNDLVPESEKTAEWYAQYARWIVATFYNQSPPSFWNNTPALVGISSNMIVNWSYYFGEQANYKFKYLETDTQGNTVPAVWIPGQKITDLVNYLSGKAVEAIGDVTPSVVNLTRDVASKRSDIYQKLLTEYQLREVMKTILPDGVEFNGANIPDMKIDSIQDVEHFASKWQDDYSQMATQIAESQIHGDQLANKFLSAARNQVVNNLSGIEITVENSKVVNNVIADYEMIWDNRNGDDPLNGKAMVTGYVKHNVPYQDVIRMFQDDLTPDDMQMIRDLAVSNDNWVTNFFNYYNAPFNNGLVWWRRTGFNNMTISYAKVYFIAPRTFPFVNGNNKHGQPRIKKTEDSGDYKGYDLYQAVLIGNKFVTKFGLADNVLRPLDDMGKPMLPIRVLCSNMALGYGKSIVHRLRLHQDYLDTLSFKIMEKIGRDYGKGYIFNGNKMDNASTEILSDLKIMGITVVKGVSGESDDPTNSQRMVEPVDMTLDANIVRYIELKREQEAEMNAIASVSEISLGQQAAVVGKGVQQNTINQNSYGTATLFYWLMKYFEDVIQYNVNLKQLLYSTTDYVEESLTVGDKGTALLKILDPQQFGTQKFKVYLQLNNVLDEAQRQRIRDIAFNEAQNGRISTLDYVKNVELQRNLQGIVKGFEYSEQKRERQASENEQASSQAQMQHEAQMQQAMLQMQAALQQNKDDNANFREEFKGLIDLIKAGAVPPEAAASNLPQQPPLSPLTVQMEGQPQEQVEPPITQQ